jgi:hypothetical protein
MKYSALPIVRPASYLGRTELRKHLVNIYMQTTNGQTTMLRVFKKV